MEIWVLSLEKKGNLKNSWHNLNLHSSNVASIYHHFYNPSKVHCQTCHPSNAENTGQKSLLSVQATTSCTVTNIPSPAPFQPKWNKLVYTRKFIYSLAKKKVQAVPLKDGPQAMFLPETWSSGTMMRQEWLQMQKWAIHKIHRVMHLRKKKETSFTVIEPELNWLSSLLQLLEIQSCIQTGALFPWT